MSSAKVPSPKPTAAVAPKPPAVNGGTGGPPATKTATTTNAAGTKKAHHYNSNSRPPYRQLQPPYPRRHRNHPRRNYCCCFCCWTILMILILVLLGAVTGTVLYFTYHPHRPSFTLASLRIHRLNLTTTADSASSHLSTLFNLTLSSKNPNKHLSFSYDPFVVSCVSSNSDVFLGEGALPGFVSNSNNETVFKGVTVTTSSDLDVDTVKGLRPNLNKKKNGILLKVEMDTRVLVKMSGLKSKKVGIRVTCDGIKGALPKGKSPVVANVAGAKCKVDLRIKIWKWTV